jgi:hypothetical protein
VAGGFGHDRVRAFSRHEKNIPVLQMVAIGNIKLDTKSIPNLPSEWLGTITPTILDCQARLMVSAGNKDITTTLLAAHKTTPSIAAPLAPAIAAANTCAYPLH